MAATLWTITVQLLLFATVIGATYAKIHGLREALTDDFWTGWTWAERLVFIGLVRFGLNDHYLHCECFCVLDR